MDWERDLPTWPLARFSRRVVCRPHRWHVQETGDGPLILLIHGAGGSCHSWRDLVPTLARTHRVVAIDLPGQGFSTLGRSDRCGLEPMAEDIAALAADQGWTPAAIVAHSAGAALALRLSQRLATPRIVAINPALAEFEGLAGLLFPVFARMLALTPMAARIFSFGGGTLPQARKLIERTGSHLTDEGLALYARLIGDAGHVDATLKMMAQWSLAGLSADLPRIEAQCLFLTGAHDLAVPPETAERAAERLPHARVETLVGLGHLAHEEAPDLVSAAILDALRT